MFSDFYSVRHGGWILDTGFYFLIKPFQNTLPQMFKIPYNECCFVEKYHELIV